MRMNNKSDTNSIRHYCVLHKQMIFDVSEVKDKFPLVSDSNFRKYVSRLVEERVLTVISKGIYFIGDELPDNLEKLLLGHYFDPRTDRPAKDYLLYKLGITETKPETLTFYKLWKKGNKKIGNLQILECKGYVLDDELETETLLDLVAAESYVSEEDKYSYVQKIVEIAYLTQGKLKFPYFLQHPRYVYSRLANWLDQLHISNEVMQEYEKQVEHTNRL